MMKNDPFLSECERAGKHVPNPGANVVMRPEIGLWGERHFGRPQLELTVEFAQVAKITSSSLTIDVMPVASTFS
jgi:hypothetical protein